MVLAREGNEKENKQNLNKRTPGLWDTQVVGMQRVSRRPRQIHPTWALLLKVHSMSFLVGRQGDRFKTHTRLLSTFNGSDCYATCLHLVFNKDFKGSIKQKKGHFEINRLWFFFFFTQYNIHWAGGEHVHSSSLETNKQNKNVKIMLRAHMELHWWHGNRIHGNSYHKRFPRSTKKTVLERELSAVLSFVASEVNEELMFTQCSIIKNKQKQKQRKYCPVVQQKEVVFKRFWNGHGTEVWINISLS